MKEFTYKYVEGFILKGFVLKGYFLRAIESTLKPSCNRFIYFLQILMWRSGLCLVTNEWKRKRLQFTNVTWTPSSTPPLNLTCHGSKSGIVQLTYKSWILTLLEETNWLEKFCWLVSLKQDRKFQSSTARDKIVKIKHDDLEKIENGTKIKNRGKIEK
mgnify:CR=1 FL=1